VKRHSRLETREYAIVRSTVDLSRRLRFRVTLSSLAQGDEANLPGHG
jgi:hypothetical protein